MCIGDAPLCRVSLTTCADDGCREVRAGESVIVQLETAGDCATEAGVVPQRPASDRRLSARLPHGQTTAGD